MPAFGSLLSAWQPARAMGFFTITWIVGSASLAGCGSGEIGPAPFFSSNPDAQIVIPSADAQLSGNVDAQSCGSGQAQIYYRDSDGDGYGDPLMSASDCAPIVGYAAQAGDCDDSNAAMHPDTDELCGDATDNNCDGSEPCMGSAVAHWAFADGKGTTLADLVEGAHDGTLRSAPVWTDTALQFDGADDYVEVAHSDAFLLDAGTVALWARTDRVDVDGGLWSKDSNGLDSGGHLSISVQGIDTSVTFPRIQARIQSTAQSFTIESDSISADTWYHVAVTFGPGGFELWLNGELANVNAYTGGMGTTSGGKGNFQPIVIGALSINSDDGAATPITSPLSGEIGDVRVYDRALSPEELGELFRNTTP